MLARSVCFVGASSGKLRRGGKGSFLGEILFELFSSKLISSPSDLETFTQSFQVVDKCYLLTLYEV